MSQLAGQTISHYEILDVVGEGGMGVVYRARDLTLDRDIALKFLPGHLIDSSESTKRFHNEAKSISALDHPNICTIHGFGEHQGQPYIAMGLVDGQTLEMRMKEGTLSLDQTIEVARQITKGLSAAHAKGIVHRDLKPANIMIDGHSVVKIMDFGLARREGNDEITQSGSTLGTLSYMSPEQVRGEAVDGRTDFWSLGVMLFELVLQRRPFSGKYDAAVMHLILNEDPDNIEAIRSISPPLLTLIERLLEKDREDRPLSAERIIDELDKISSQHVNLSAKGTPSTIHAVKPERNPSSFFRSLRRRRFLPIVGSYLAVAIGLLEVVPYLIDQYKMDQGLHQILLIWVLAGFPLAGLIAYFHGRKGRDRISRVEVGLFSIVLLVAAGLSFFSWQGSREQGKPVAEQNIAKQNAAPDAGATGVNIAALRTNLTKARSDMLNEKLAAEKVNAVTRAKILFDQGLAFEQTGDDKYTEGTAESLTDAAQSYVNARDAFRKAGAEARMVAKSQQVVRAEINSRKGAEAARSSMLNNKLSVGGDASLKYSISDFQQALRKESDGRANFENGDFVRAKTLFDEAERLYRNAATEVDAKGGADSAKDRMSTTKARISAASRNGPEYEGAVKAQIEGEKSYAANRFAEAEKHFQIAQSLFTEASRVKKSTQPSVDQGLATAEITGMVGRHESYIASGNLQGLKQLGVDTDMWVQSRFFESTEDRKVQSTSKITIQGATAAMVELSVVIDFKIKNNTQNPLRFSRLWQLEHTNGRWAIIKDTKVN